MRISIASLSVVLLSLATACSSSGGEGGTTPAGDDAGGEDVLPTEGLELTKGLAIKEVAVFQGPKVVLERDGAKNTDRRAPVVVGRAGVLRVYVEPAADWAPRDVVATLKLESNGETKTITEKKTVAEASTDAKLDSTFNFTIDGLVAADTKYSVSLKTEPGQPSSAGSDRSQYPAEGLEPMDAVATGEMLRVKIVPVKYDADGSGRLPDVSEGQLELYRKRFAQLYPARKVEITVRDPFPWATPIQRNGSGFSELLRAIVRLRMNDGAPKGVYYYGAFAPGSSFWAWCQGACVSGLSPLATNPGDTWTAASIGLGFGGETSVGTATHEVGHGHGRKHAPCRVSDADPQYPKTAEYAGAKIGPWSWDVEGKKLVSPASVTDFMSYCQPDWMSDYTFGALATRMSYVYGGAFVVGASPKSFRLVGVDGSGKLEWGEEVTTAEPNFGEPHVVHVEAEQGKTDVTGYYYPWDHLPGGLLVLPTGAAKVQRITVRDLVPNVVSRLEVARP